MTYFVRIQNLTAGTQALFQIKRICLGVTALDNLPSKYVAFYKLSCDLYRGILFTYTEDVKTNIEGLY
jgi:hypothetical protein